MTGESESKCYEEVMTDVHKEKWYNAMQEEMDSLHENYAYELMELPEGKKALRNKWVYKLKTGEDGSTPRYKARIVVKGFQQKKGVDFDVALGNALLNMYATYGALEEICIVFQKMEQRSIVSWNAVLVAYSHYGAVEVVYHLFSIMYQDGVQPDEVTFVCLLSTCSRGGFLEKAKYAFCCMTRDFNIIPEMEHYNCIIDLVGRAGHLDEAENIIHKIPFEPDIQIWVTFLGVCSLYGDPLGGERAWKRLVHLSPNSTAPHVLLSNIYVTHSKETMT